MEFLTLQEQQARYRASRERIWSAGIRDEKPTTQSRIIPIKYQPFQAEQLPPKQSEYGPLIEPIRTIHWRRLPLESKHMVCLEAAGYGDFVPPRSTLKEAHAIKAAVCAGTNITPAGLDSESRYPSLVRPRQLAMYRIRTELGWSLPRIGKFFGNRDHTTVLHAVRSVEAARRAVSE
jgi:hypothetical protein